MYCVWPGEWFHSWQSVVIRWRGAALGWNPRRRLCTFHSHVIYYSVFIIQCTSFWTVVPAPTCGMTFCSTSHLHSHSRSSDSVSRLSSSLVPTWTCWYDLLIITDYYCFFSGISRGPCNNWHYLGHVKHVDDDDDVVIKISVALPSPVRRLHSVACEEALFSLVCPVVCPVTSVFLSLARILKGCWWKCRWSNAICHFVSSITYYCDNGRCPNMLGVGKGWPSRTD